MKYSSVLKLPSYEVIPSLIFTTISELVVIVTLSHMNAYHCVVLDGKLRSTFCLHVPTYLSIGLQNIFCKLDVHLLEYHWSTYLCNIFSRNCFLCDASG